jgi:hypothetical protein
VAGTAPVGFATLHELPHRFFVWLASKHTHAAAVIAPAVITAIITAATLLLLLVLLQLLLLLLLHIKPCPGKGQKKAFEVFVIPFFSEHSVLFPSKTNVSKFFYKKIDKRIENRFFSLYFVSTFLGLSRRGEFENTKKKHKKSTLVVFLASDPPTHPPRGSSMFFGAPLVRRDRWHMGLSLDIPQDAGNLTIGPRTTGTLFFCVLRPVLSLLLVS